MVTSTPDSLLTWIRNLRSCLQDLPPSLKAGHLLLIPLDPGKHVVYDSKASKFIQ